MNRQNYLRHNISMFVVICATGLLFVSCANKGKGDKNISEPKTVLRLPPSENNPRNSEGDFISLKDGRILYVYTHYYEESASDHAPAYLAGRYSDDGGKTWTREDEVVLENEGGMNVMSVSLLRLQNDDIALFYLRKNSIEDCIPMMSISKDEAKTWSDPVTCITDKEGYFVLNNDRVIQLDDGRLLMAVALHNTSDSVWRGEANLFSYFSDDNGMTWHSSEQVPNTSDIITQEPGLIEMKDGRIMMYIRATGGFQQLSYSSDRGETWSHIEQSNIPSPLSPATIEKIPGKGDWILVWNNNDGSIPEMKGKRTPLTVAVSRDEGKTWEKIKNIHDNPEGWYGYIAIHFVDDENILLSHGAGTRPEGTKLPPGAGLEVTEVTLINRTWLYH